MLVLVSVTVFGVTVALNNKKTMGTLTSPNLSPVARQLVMEYNSLPAESRPFPDIVSIVKALDEKTSIDADAREKHFNDNWYAILNEYKYGSHGYDFTWKKDYGCDHGYCPFREYGDIHRAIKAVKESIAAKERAILESRHEGDTAMAKELMTRLRSEAELNHTFVQEFKALS